MFGIHDYGLFVLSAVLLNLAPGQDTLYILGRSIAQGRRIGVASALGVSAGTGRPYLRAMDSMKCMASGTMSSRRSRSGGKVSVSTFSRK